MFIKFPLTIGKQTHYVVRREPACLLLHIFQCHNANKAGLIMWVLVQYPISVFVAP